MRKYLAGKLKELATARGISSRKAAEMARRGEIPGAAKVGNRWEVPLTPREAAAARGISVRTAQRQGKTYADIKHVVKPPLVKVKTKTPLKKDWVKIARRKPGYIYHLPDPRTHSQKSAKDFMRGVARKGAAGPSHVKARKDFEDYVMDKTGTWTYGNFDKFVSTDVMK
jgi:hypothetical protein